VKITVGAEILHRDTENIKIKKIEIQWYTNISNIDKEGRKSGLSKFHQDNEISRKAMSR
jgi:hypothetical protein